MSVLPVPLQAAPHSAQEISASQMLAVLANMNEATFTMEGQAFARELVFQPQGLLPAVVLRAQQLARFFCDGNPTLRDSAIGAEIHPGAGLLRCVADVPRIPVGDPTPRSFFRALLLQQAAGEIFGWHRREPVAIAEVARAFESEMAKEGLIGLLTGPIMFFPEHPSAALLSSILETSQAARDTDRDSHRAPVSSRPQAIASGFETLPGEFDEGGIAQRSLSGAGGSSTLSRSHGSA